MKQTTFNEAGLGEVLSGMSDAELNELNFGVIALDNDCVIQRYNSYLSILSGISIENSVGHHLFITIAPCMNNFMVAQKLENAIDKSTILDETIDYVLSVKMKPTKVKIRLLHHRELQLNFVLIVK